MDLHKQYGGTAPLTLLVYIKLSILSSYADLNNT